MKQSEDILKELKEVAPLLAKLEKKEFLSAPENYFASFSSEMSELVKWSDAKEEVNAIAPSLAKLKEQTADAHAGYFASFSQQMVEMVRATEVMDELQLSAPVLAKLQKANLEQAPTNYFAAFPQAMLKQVLKSGKRPSAQPQWLQNLNKMFDGIAQFAFQPRYSFAYAGALTVALVAVLFFFEQPAQQTCNDIACQMSELSDDDIEGYLASNDAGSFALDLQDDDFSADEISDNTSALDELEQLDDETLNEAILD